MNMTKKLRIDAEARLQELYGFRREMIDGAEEIGNPWRSVQNQIAYLESILLIPNGGKIA